MRVRIGVRRLGIDGVAGVVVRYQGRVLLLCEELLDADERAREGLCNDLLAELDGDGPASVEEWPPLRAVS